LQQRILNRKRFNVQAQFTSNSSVKHEIRAHL